MHRFFIVALGTLLSLVLPASFTFADTSPSVTSFTADASSVSNALSGGFSWTMNNSTGNSLLFLCPTGVSVTNADGSAVACNQRHSAPGNRANGSAGFNFYNISGAPKQLQVRIYPKDSYGNDVEVSRDLYITVNPAVRPIHDFTLSTSTTASGNAVALTWTSSYISGVNLRFDCVSGVSVSASADGAQLPCGTPAFSTDLTANGSQTIYVTNTSASAVSLPITLLPAIQSGLYDGGNSAAQSLTVLLPPPMPEVTLASVSISTQTLPSGQPLLLAWSTHNAIGANIQVSCSTGVTFFAANGTEISCGAPAFAKALPSSGTTTISMKNNDIFSRHAVSVYILPQRQNGTYFFDGAHPISLSVLAADEKVPVAATSTAPALATTTPALAAMVGAPKWNLTLTLRSGMKHAQVATLQTFLALDKALYPEAAVSGFFGPATLRAVKLFQKRYLLSKEGDSAFGTVGPMTRAKINALVKP